MPDLYFKVSIHHDEWGFAEIDTERLSDKLLDVVNDMFPACECVVSTLSNQKP